MYIPERFSLNGSEYSRIYDVFYIMMFIWTHRIVHYDIDAPETYPIYPMNFHLVKICQDREDAMLSRSQFTRINSVEKITWKNFCSIVHKKCPEFDEKRFVKNMRVAQMIPSDQNILFAIFLHDIDTQEDRDEVKKLYEKIFQKELNKLRKDWWTPTYEEYLVRKAHGTLEEEDE